MKAVVLTPVEVERPDADLYLTDLVPTVTDDTSKRVGYHGKGRGWKYLWEIEALPDGEEGVSGGAPAIRFAELRTGHDRDRKAFYASVGRVVRGGRGYGDRPDLTLDELRAGRYFMESFMLFAGVTLLVERVERYSEKRMAEFSAKALGLLRLAMHDDTGLVLAKPDARAKLHDVFGYTLLHTEVTATVVNLDPADTLRGLQGAVGGDIEPILFPEPFEAYANEEAKIIGDGLTPNTVATELWKATAEAGEYLTQPGDYIAGPVVVVGPLDDDGGTQGLTDDQVDLLLHLLAAHGAKVPITA